MKNRQGSSRIGWKRKRKKVQVEKKESLKIQSMIKQLSEGSSFIIEQLINYRENDISR